MEPQQFTIQDNTEHLAYNPLTYVPKKKQEVVEPEIQLDPEVEKIRQTIKYMESRGEKDPYNAFNYASEKNYGSAIGAYQIKEATLKDNSMKFLGKKVTPDEFKKSPELQDQFVRAEIKYLQKAGYKTNSLFAAHHGGWSDQTRNATIKRNTQYEVYMDEAMKYYDSLTQKEKAQVQKELATKKTETKTPAKTESKSILQNIIASLIKSVSKK